MLTVKMPPGKHVITVNNTHIMLSVDEDNNVSVLGQVEDISPADTLAGFYEEVNDEQHGNMGGSTR